MPGAHFDVTGEWVASIPGRAEYLVVDSGNVILMLEKHYDEKWEGRRIWAKTGEGVQEWKINAGTRCEARARLRQLGSMR
jgi:hypothetical protein